MEGLAGMLGAVAPAAAALGASAARMDPPASKPVERSNSRRVMGMTRAGSEQRGADATPLSQRWAQCQKICRSVAAGFLGPRASRPHSI